MIANENICGLILAAGLSSRMGEFKPLMPFRGKTLIENAIDSVFVGGASHVVVVTGYRGDELESLIQSRYDGRVTTVRNNQYACLDMMHSIKIGCKCMPECKAFFLLPGDMPVVRPSTFKRLLLMHPKEEKAVTFPTLEGYRKHPPLISYQFINEIMDFSAEGGLRELWKHHEDLIYTVPVDDEGVWIDLDTQEDYAKCVKRFKDEGNKIRNYIISNNLQEVNERKWKRSVNL